ncbi:hypothetical protein [Acetobacter sp. DsW_063]|uniref:hypothetical protein n=1 Tax=Acetobacter sp. DsW_063 TaxID=1514894 RepID=UPI000A3648F7|nr:hypothetical protein [Acetobacter sp. DsW_063]OUJ13789.1 hypothetical protein HK28_01225 [Acetobacter sp. DsW_063]
MNQHVHGQFLREFEARERRIELLLQRLPGRIRGYVRWLRRPESRWARLPAGVFLILGGCLAVLPVFGLWMLPLGIFILAEDVPALRRLTDRALVWVEERRPHWMGLPRAPSSR